MTYKEQLDAALKRAAELQEKAKNGELTDEELAEVKTVVGQVEDLNAKVKAAAEGQALLAKLGQSGKQAAAGVGADGAEAAKSLGDHFVKSLGAENIGRLKSSGFSFTAPEFKAATDATATGGPTGALGPVLTQVDTSVVTAVRRRLTIADLLGSGTLSGQAITYFVEAAKEGDAGTTAEGGSYSQIHYPNPTAVTEALSKITGIIGLTDEMAEDLAFLVSEINGRLLYDLSVKEEDQLLSGDGTGTNLKGVLNRSGIQTLAAATGVSGADNADAVFRAITAVSTTGGLDADGIVIHPTDYQKFRLSKDSNGQYFGGGFFAGQYGQGGIIAQPPLWGLRTVVTPAVSSGTVVVGAFTQAATLYRKGGVTVESTNSNGTDFQAGKIAIRAHERLALAVRRPAGFVKLTLDYAAS